MKNSLKQSIHLLFSAGVLFFTVAQNASADSSSTYTLVGETTLIATSSNGSMTVTPAAVGSGISIFSSNCNSTELPLITSSSPVVTITGVSNCNLNLSVPISLLVELYTDNGAVQSSGAFPSIIVRAKNGPVTVSGSSGTLVDATSTNGDVRLSDIGVLGSKLTAGSDNGDVRLTRVNGPFSVKAVNGDIIGNTVVFPGGSQSSFTNSNGDISLRKVTVTKRARDNKNFKLTARGSTRNGSVRISSGPRTQGSRRFSNSGTVFSGVEPKASVTLRTVNGDVLFLR